MKSVMFDVTPLMPERLSGVGIYTQQLYKGLKNIGVDLTPVYKASRVFNKNFISEHIHQSGSAFIDRPRPFQTGGTVLHGTDFKLLSGNSKFKKILTVHDLGVYREDLLDKSFCREGQRKLTEELDKQPDAIIVPSHFILGEFLTRFPKYRDKTHVVSHGCDHLRDKTSLDAGSVGRRDAPFFLYAGHMEKRKNVALIVKGFERFCQRQEGVDLVLVGKDGFGAKTIHQIIDQSPFRSRIVRLGYVRGPTLKSLYQKCVSFVYPSLYEGFGMPVIEAMQLGAPVITANTSATGEVAGSGAHLVNPLEVEELEFAYKKLFEDQGYRSQIQALGQERAQEFSWIQTARETLKIYKNE